jgi:D-3-phosphoglycerate dehydrogenase
MSLPVVLRTDAELNMGASWPSESSRYFRITTAEDDKKKTLIRLAPQAQILFTCYAPITAEVIAAGEQLQGIVKYGVGVDSIDLEAAAKCGVPVVHCPDYGKGTVSDHAFALLISVARKITLIDQNMRTQDWLWPEPKYRGVDLAGKTLGIVGFGRIGRAVARRGEGFGMRRLVCDPYVPHDTEGWRNLEFAPLDQVIEQSDFLSLHCVLTPETKGLLDADVLGRMKRSAVVVNVSRGELIDQAALVDSLRRGALAGAGLDVFLDEPLDRDHPLRDLPNVILTPHVAFYTLEAYERLESECLRAVKDLLAGELPKNVKNAEALRRHGYPLAPTAGISSVEPVAGSRVASPTREEGSQHWLLTEGDTNLSPLRERWQEDCLDAETRQLLKRDGRAFLHQSLSTPCLTSLANCDGIYLIDEQGRRYMDFHGNSAHQVGYRHPRVIEAIKQQLDVLPFCPRRFTNRPAIELAEKLAALAPDPLPLQRLMRSNRKGFYSVLKISVDTR